MEKVFASVRFSSPLSVAVARTSQSPFPLCGSLKDDTETKTPLK
jgi:aminoglycoside 6'-N-acetyltransferase I